VEADDERPVDPGRQAALTEETAAHIGAEFDTRRSRCRSRLLAVPEVAHIGHYTSGLFDFDLDVLEQPGTPSSPTGASPRRQREELRRAGRQLSFQLSRTDRRLQALMSGDLIRTVLQTPHATLYCNRVVPTVYVVGLTRHRGPVARPGTTLPTLPEVVAGDRALAALVTELRQDLSRGAQYPGGWEEVGPPPRDWPEPEVTAVVHTEGADGPERAAVIRALDPDGLHYLAAFGSDRVAWSVDILSHPHLSRFHTDLTVAARRQAYTDLGRQIETELADFARIARPVLGGPLLRLVLDVEQGAIYFYRTTPDTYLIGVTLDQHRVARADAVIGALVATEPDGT
jgi:hypothetical protein